MNINFSFDEKNVQVGFENQFVVKDFTNKTLVKLLMLKGEKGDTANSEWGNITGSITNQTDLSNALNNKADTTDIPTDLNQLSNTTTKFVNENQLQAVITSLGSIFTLKGSVATVNDLPSQNNNIGDVYYVVSESAGYIWIDDDGTLRWEQLGMTVDTSDFLTKSGLLSSTGNSTTNTMHQSAITAALYNKADKTDIPTKTSDLTNDSGFITTETDPVFTNSVAHEITSTDITNWNNKSTFSGNYNDLTNKPTIPDELSDLSDDSTHRLVTDAEKTTWNAKSDFSGSYTDLTNKPTIPTVPTDVSSFNNDAGYLTSVPSEYVTETELNSKGYLTSGDLYFQPGDTFECDNEIILSGFITSGATSVSVSFPSPKRLDNITSITCQSFKGEARGIKGYLNGEAGSIEYVGRSGYTTIIKKSNNNIIIVKITKSSAWTNVDNNTPVVFIIGIGSLKLTFN